MMGDVNESDWKLFRRKLPEWQEAYMGKLVEEYKEQVSALQKRIVQLEAEKDKK